MVEMRAGCQVFAGCFATACHEPERARDRLLVMWRSDD
ncbi:hypothetical protein LHGZ1_2054 [Laribacter hongkongensis]|uniref:Uncharacterized protein n=1 Tax=Laribacter hongkongensis TaxID=168471 RepID=A0A248LK14_9NEIS|nr:hypothetical protein LHGZ1_2054 [Laribacter hongkongensis]